MIKKFKIFEEMSYLDEYTIEIDVDLFPIPVNVSQSVVASFLFSHGKEIDFKQTPTNSYGIEVNEEMNLV